MGLKGFFLRSGKRLFDQHITTLDHDAGEIEKAVSKIHEKSEHITKDLSHLTEKNAEFYFEVLLQHNYYTNENPAGISNWGKFGLAHFSMDGWGRVFDEIVKHPEKFKRDGDSIICIDKSLPAYFSIDYDKFIEVKKRNRGLIRKVKKLLIKLFHLSIVRAHLKREELEKAKDAYRTILEELNSK